MAQNRARRPDEEVDRKRDRPAVPTRHAGAQEQQVDARADLVQSLQRLAGNRAVSAWLGQVSVQRDDAGTPVATADAGTAAAADADITALELQADVADAAKALKAAVPAVHLTIGRRSLEEGALAVATNIVANRSYVDGFADSGPKKLIKKWVDDHPTATRQEIIDALVVILTPMNDTERSYWSLHLGGRAFDISPSSCTLAEVQRLFPQALEEQTHWHVQFVTHWSKP